MEEVKSLSFHQNDGIRSFERPGLMVLQGFLMIALHLTR